MGATVPRDPLRGPGRRELYSPCTEVGVRTQEALASWLQGTVGTAPGPDRTSTPGPWLPGTWRSCVFLKAGGAQVALSLNRQMG